MRDNTESDNKARLYRVVQWAAGRIGRSAMRATIKHPQLQLVGLHVHSESKEGQDAGTLCAGTPIGIFATRSMDAVLALKPDCVLYMQEGFDVGDMCRLLESGINIVTTRSEFFYAKAMDAEIRRKIENACQKGGASLFATGSSPGFITEVVPLALLYMSRRLDCLTIDEFAYVPGSTSPEMITNVMGFGRPMPEEFNAQMVEHVAIGFAQSLAAVADAIGVTIDRFENKGEFALANTPVALPGGAVIEKGMTAAQRITVAGVSKGKPILQFRANWYCSRDIDKGWELSENGWRVLVEGDTPVDVRISYPRTSEPFADQMSGLTAHPAVNAVPYVCEAAPGILTNMDLPLVVPKLLSATS